MSVIYTRRRRSQSFGSFGSFSEALAVENSSSSRPSCKPELIEGYAHICFLEEQAQCFRGILLTADGTSYTLTAKRSRLGVTEEGKEDQQQQKPGNTEGDQSPDVLHDYPSPLRSHGSTGEMGPCSRQSSLDAKGASDLQFVLEELPDGQHPNSQPASLPGSPPTTQQIIRALDKLLIRNAAGGPLQDDPGPELGNASPCLSPFRSRSGSKSGQPIETVSVMFDVSVSDLEDGTQHTIRNVGGRKGNTFTLRNRQLCFVTERAFW